MWPWEHLAVGDLWYVGVIEGLDSGEQELATLTALAVGHRSPT
jgi:hypothetical protein